MPETLSDSTYPATAGYWQLVWWNFRKQRLAVCGLWVTIFLSTVAVFAPLIANDRPLLIYCKGHLTFPIAGNDTDFQGISWHELRPKRLFMFQLNPAGIPGLVIWPPVPYSPFEYNLLEILAPPSLTHWCGTDDRGRDILSRMVYGARISLSVGFVAVGISLFIGIILGALAGYFGGVLDNIISRAIEIFLTIPTFFLIIAIIAFLPPSIYNIMVVIGFTGWTGVARFVRAEFLKLKQTDFVLALRALGASHMRIIFKHMLPNAMAPVLTTAVFGIAGAILTESSLSFLGFGVPPPIPSWGDILSQSRDYIEFAWWLATFPGLAIFISITAYNLVGEGLRDAMDPKLFR